MENERNPQPQAAAEPAPDTAAQARKANTEMARRFNGEIQDSFNLFTDRNAPVVNTDFDGDQTT